MLMEIKLTDDQAGKLRGLIDLALKAGGLQIARVATEIDDLILAADAARSAVAPVEPVEAAA
jgi:hypothetical protein